jgi:hypothetical protein
MLLLCFNLKAAPSRKPAIVKTKCDLNNPEVQIKSGSEKIFVSELTHELLISTVDGIDCSEVKGNRFSDLIYEKYARQEIQLLFNRNPKNYIKSCEDYFASQNIKKTEYKCLAPRKMAIIFKNITCENKLTKAKALVTYEHESVLLEEKSACAVVNECIKVASEDELAELNKLATITCKNNLILPDSGKAPVLIQDTQGFDGRRILDSKETNIKPSFEQLELKNIGK